MSDLETARRWARLRVPDLVFTLGPTVTVVLVVVLTWDEPGGYLATLDEVVSWGSFLSDLTFGMFLGVVLLAWYVPRPAALLTTVALLPWFDPGENLLVRQLWWMWALVLVADVILRNAQAHVSRPPGSALAPDVAAAVGAFDPWRLERRVATAVLLVAAVGVSAVWLDRRETFAALDGRAVSGTGVVEAVHPDVGYLDVTVDDSTYEFWVDDAPSFEVGRTVPVMIDPTGAERPWGLGDADPDGWTDLVVLAGALLALALAVGATGPLRARRLRTLLEDQHDPGWLVDVTWDDDDLLVSSAEDPRHRALARLQGVVGFGDGDPDAGDDDDRWLTDAELEDLHRLDPEGEVHDERPSGPATVHGLTTLGGPTVVVLDDQEVLVALRPARDPWTLPFAKDLVGSPDSWAWWRRSGGAAGYPTPAEHQRVDEATVDVPLSPVRHLLPWAGPLVGVLVVIVLVGTWWMTSGDLDSEDGPGWVWIALVGAAVADGLAVLHTAARPPLTVAGETLRLHATFSTLHVPSSRVVRVRRRHDYVAVDLTDPVETVSVHDDPAWGRLDDLARIAQEAADARSSPGARTTVRPGQGALVAAATAAAVLAGALLGSGGALPLL